MKSILELLNKRSKKAWCDICRTREARHFIPIKYTHSARGFCDECWEWRQRRIA